MVRKRSTNGRPAERLLIVPMKTDEDFNQYLSDVLYIALNGLSMVESLSGNYIINDSDTHTIAEEIQRLGKKEFRRKYKI